MDTLLNSNSDTDERRKLPRVKRLKMVACLSGQNYATDNWSMGGFLLEDYEGGLSTGALVTIEGLGRCSRTLQTVSLPGRVERIGENSIAISYLSLDAQAYEFLQKAMSESGNMRNLVEQSIYTDRLG